MSFDCLAPHYDWMEAVSAGGRLQRVRTAWMDELRDCRRILSVGEGHGRFASACAACWPDAELTCVDASPRMLARARQRTRDAGGRIQWQCAALPEWTPGGKYDAIVTCFFLDCFPPGQLAEVIARLAASATPGAVWLVADFAVPAAGWARRRALFVHQLMYAFFRVVTHLPARRLTPPDEWLLAHGFRLQGRREFEWGLLRADLWRRV